MQFNLNKLIWIKYAAKTDDVELVKKHEKKTKIRNINKNRKFVNFNLTLEYSTEHFIIPYFKFWKKLTIFPT